MSPMISIPFQFHDQSYSMLLSQRQNGDKLQFRVTVMNGDLEKTLHGNAVFEYNNGVLAAEQKELPAEVVELQSSVIMAIDKYCLETLLQQTSLS